MFSLIYNSPLSDMLAPRLSPLEDFIFQWDSFTAFFSPEQNPDVDLCKVLIESTNLSSKLSSMLNIVLDEQADLLATTKDATEICPSLEYILQNKVLDTLSAIAQADTPLGICPRLLLFFNRLLVECKTPLLPLIAPSINKLIYICGKLSAGPYESTEMVFLSSLTDQIYRNPQYLAPFLADSYPLINSLLALLCSPDSEITRRAGDCIIKLICLSNETAETIITEKTAFCGKIIHQIITFYNEIPRSLTPAEVEIAIYTFRNDEACSESFTNSMRKFLCFLKWYIFFDMLVYHSTARSPLVNRLLSQFRREFLESFIVPDLSGDGFKDEADAIDHVFLTTVLLSNCLRNTESFTLFNCIAEFLALPEEGNVELSLPSVQSANSSILAMLLRRCNIREMQQSSGSLEAEEEAKKKSTKLASATLQLFEDILLRPSRKLVDYLVLRHLKRKQSPGSLSGSPGALKVEENADSYEPILEKMITLDTMETMTSVANEIRELKLANIAGASTIEPVQQNATLYYFASLIPAELKFGIENESADYSAYLKEAVKGVHIFLTSCYAHWPEVEASGEQSIEGKQRDCTEDDSGPFLGMILDNLNAMLSMPYEISLQVFSLIAKLSLIPEESINESFLEPSLVAESSHNLFAVLYRLVEDLQVSVQGIADLQRALSTTKKSLLGEELSHEEMQIIEGDEAHNTTTILQSLIVLDEFCKEVVCIVYAKNRILQLAKEEAVLP